MPPPLRWLTRTRFCGTVPSVGRSRLLPVCLLLLGLSLAAPAHAVPEDDSRVLAQASRLLEAGRSEEALRQLQHLESQLAGRTDFDLLLGQAFVRTGDWSQAQFSLERVLIQDESHHAARLAMAGILVQRREMVLAEQELDRLAADNPSAATRREMAAIRQRIREASVASGGAGTRTTGYVKLSLGYDDNVTSGPDADALLIPAYSATTPTSLGSSAQDGDALAMLSVGGTVRHPLAADHGLLGGLSLSQNLHTGRHDEDEGYGNLYLGGYGQAGQELFSLVALGQLHGVEGALYRYHWGGQLNWQHRIGDGNDWWNSYVHYINYTYPDSADDNAERYGLGVNLLQESGPGKSPTRTQYGLYGGIEAARSSGVDYVGYDFLGGKVEVVHPAYANIDLLAGAAYEWRRHDGAETLYRTTREDDQFSLDLGLDYTFSERWHLTPSVHFTHNASNLDLYEYDRLMAGITLKREFGR